MRAKVDPWSSFKRQFFAGLVIFLPVSLTIYLCRFFFLLISQMLLPLVTHQHWFPLRPAAVRPLSFLLTLFLIWFLGLLASDFTGKRLLNFLESGIQRLPFLRGFYEAFRRMSEAFFGTKPLYRSVVLVEYPRKGVYTLGFVTNHLTGKLFHTSEAYLSVFVPTVPNPTSGLLLYVPQSETIPLALSIEDAAKILVSHGFVSLEEKAVRAR